MKNYKYPLYVLPVGLFALVSCSDFEEVNTNPTAADIEQVRIEYAINKSITGTQQSPEVAERYSVLSWQAVAYQVDPNVNGGLPIGRYNDDWISNYYSHYASQMSPIVPTINLVEKKMKGKLNSYEAQMIPNMKEMTRIWRVCLMSGFTDSFGAVPIEAFAGENPKFNSCREVYYFILDELKDATSEVKTGVRADDKEKECDCVYKFGFDKWVKYASSIRMRLAMRLSEVDAAKAKTEFEDAAKDAYVSESGGNFIIREQPGQDDLIGVMTREWNYFPPLATMNNLLIGLGGIVSDEQPAGGNDLLVRIKSVDCVGVQYINHYALTTNDPAKGFWFDGLHKVTGPRTYRLFSIPSNFGDANYYKYPLWNSSHEVVRRKLLKDKDDADGLVELDATFAWNTVACGEWDDKGSLNKMYYWPWVIPYLVLRYRESENSRIFFTSWESYFLLAETALKGWSIPMSAKAAYEQGVHESFACHGVGGFVDAYLMSEDYNNVGTSTKWEHVAKPVAIKTMKVVSGYTKAESTYTFTYPVASETLCGKVLNSHPTKIITQKYTAQVSWLPLGAWNDRHGLDLPFSETPAVEQAIRTMPSLNASNYMKQTTKFFPQRLRLLSGLENSSPEGYKQTVQLFGGPDDVFTPLRWAKK